MRAIFSKLGNLNRIPRTWLSRVALVVMLVAFVLLGLSLLDRRSMMVDDVITFHPAIHTSKLTISDSMRNILRS
jgi:hypothetical protein